MTQRKYSRMVLIKPRLEFDRLEWVGEDEVGTYTCGGRMVVSAPGMEDLIVPFRSSFPTPSDAKIQVWDDLVHAFDEGDSAATWFTTFLTIPCRLMIKDTRHTRPTDPIHTPPPNYFPTYTPQSAFSDGYPFLLLSTSSIANLNTILEKENLPPVSALNFRPNILINTDNLEPHIEDTYLRITINRYPFFIACRCTRCQMPSNDIATGKMGKDVTKTIMRYRRVDEGDKFKACFGVNAISGGTGFIIKVRDPLEVQETAEHNRKGGVWNGGGVEVPVVHTTSGAHEEAKQKGVDEVMGGKGGEGGKSGGTVMTRRRSIDITVRYGRGGKGFSGVFGWLWAFFPNFSAVVGRWWPFSL
ncbi:hypothetical protein HDV00_005515 [Rhizophlyctis rosea]|nr:hypothetical protein HDV00_005515 [Rhizophlyctis rosea]